jgi:urease accessory protein
MGEGLLRLMWMVSPALPIGSYAYSRGLEYAVNAGWVHDGESAGHWIEGVLRNQLATLDAPLLVRLHEAFRTSDLTAAGRWSRFLCAARESAETALEDRQLGLALARVLGEAGVELAASFRAGGYATLFALGCVAFDIAAHDAVLGYLFAFVEGQVTSASKLVPLGQRAAQSVLQPLLTSVEELAHAAFSVSDDELGAFTPGLALASALHETQYARLFRS